jgi:hypothetical protein
MITNSKKQSFFRGAMVTVMLLFVGGAWAGNITFTPPTVSYLGDEVMTVTVEGVAATALTRVQVNGRDVPYFMPLGQDRLVFVTPPGQLNSYATVTLVFGSNTSITVPRAFRYFDQQQQLSLLARYPRLLPTNTTEHHEYFLLTGGSFDSDLQVWIGQTEQHVATWGKLGATIEVFNIDTPGTYDLTIQSKGRQLVASNALEFETGVSGKLYGAVPNNFSIANTSPILLLGEGISANWPDMPYKYDTCPATEVVEDSVRFSTVLGSKAGYIPALLPLGPAEDISRYFPAYPLMDVLVEGGCDPSGTASAVLLVEVGMVPGHEGHPCLVLTPYSQCHFKTAGSWTVSGNGSGGEGGSASHNSFSDGRQNYPFGTPPVGGLTPCDTWGSWGTVQSIIGDINGGEECYHWDVSVYYTAAEPVEKGAAVNWTDLGSYDWASGCRGCDDPCPAY